MDFFSKLSNCLKGTKLIHIYSKKLLSKTEKNADFYVNCDGLDNLSHLWSCIINGMKMETNSRLKKKVKAKAW